MTSAEIPGKAVAIDHVHLVSRDPLAAADWYVRHFGFERIKRVDVMGAPQIYLRMGESLVVIRGTRGAESPGSNGPKQWGIEHFGLRIRGDFDALCERLRQDGVPFLMAPVDINAVTRVAFVQAPDAVSVELLDRKEWPDLVQLGADDTYTRQPQTGTAG